MTDQNDVRRIALALPQTSEAGGHFGVAVANKASTSSSCGCGTSASSRRSPEFPGPTCSPSGAPHRRLHLRPRPSHRQWTPARARLRAAICHQLRGHRRAAFRVPLRRYPALGSSPCSCAIPC